MRGVPTNIGTVHFVGIGGIGSVFTSLLLVEGSIQLLSKHLIGESAQEPMRVTEKLHQETFWQ